MIEASRPCAERRSISTRVRSWAWPERENGQAELAEMLTDLWRAPRGRVFLAEEEIPNHESLERCCQMR